MTRISRKTLGNVSSADRRDISLPRVPMPRVYLLLSFSRLWYWNHEVICTERLQRHVLCLGRKRPSSLGLPSSGQCFFCHSLSLILTVIDCYNKSLAQSVTEPPSQCYKCHRTGHRAMYCQERSGKTPKSSDESRRTCGKYSGGGRDSAREEYRREDRRRAETDRPSSQSRHSDSGLDSRREERREKSSGKIESKQRPEEKSDRKSEGRQKDETDGNEKQQQRNRYQSLLSPLFLSSICDITVTFVR